MNVRNGIAILVACGLISLGGCGGDAMGPAPATEEELEAYKTDVYGSEAEHQEDMNALNTQ